MLALKNLGFAIKDDRPQNKQVPNTFISPVFLARNEFQKISRFARTPNYAVDVKWLHSVAQQLGEFLPETKPSGPRTVIVVVLVEGASLPVHNTHV